MAEPDGGYTVTHMTMSEALNQALHQMMTFDDSIIVLGEDVVGGAGLPEAEELGGVFGVTKGLAVKFGASRVMDTPISEASFVGMGLGAAMMGLKPVIELMFCDFMGVAFDQILNQAAKASFLSAGRVKVPLVIRTTMGAGDNSAAMHSQSLHALVAQIPGLHVVCPSTPADAAGLLKAAVAVPEPVIFFEHKGLYDRKGPVVPDLPPVPLGQGRVVRAGSEATIVAVGAMVPEAEEAAVILHQQHGLDVEVIDPRTISPLDVDLIIASVAKTGHLLVVDEGTAFCGFADAVVSVVSQKAFSVLRAAPAVVTPPHSPVPYGIAAEKAWLPDAHKIVQAVKTLQEDGYSA